MHSVQANESQAGSASTRVLYNVTSAFDDVRRSSSASLLRGVRSSSCGYRTDRHLLQSGDL